MARENLRGLAFRPTARAAVSRKLRQEICTDFFRSRQVTHGCLTLIVPGCQRSRSPRIIPYDGEGRLSHILAVVAAQRCDANATHLWQLHLVSPHRSGGGPPFTPQDPFPPSVEPSRKTMHSSRRLGRLHLRHYLPHHLLGPLPRGEREHDVPQGWRRSLRIYEPGLELRKRNLVLWNVAVDSEGLQILNGRGSENLACRTCLPWLPCPLQEKKEASACRLCADLDCIGCRCVVCVGRGHDVRLSLRRAFCCPHPSNSWQDSDATLTSLATDLATAWEWRSAILWAVDDIAYLGRSSRASYTGETGARGRGPGPAFRGGSVCSRALPRKPQTSASGRRFCGEKSLGPSTDHIGCY